MSDERMSGASLQVFVLGALVGVGLGLLLAPRSGAETRRKLADLASKAREKTTEFGAKLRREAEEITEEARRKMGA